MFRHIGDIIEDLIKKIESQMKSQKISDKPLPAAMCEEEIAPARKKPLT